MKKLIIAIVVALFVLAGGVTAFFFVKNKDLIIVAKVTKNTYDKAQILSDISLFSYTGDGDYHANIALSNSKDKLKIRYDQSKDVKQIIMKKKLDIPFLQDKLYVIGQKKGDKIKIQFPNIISTVFVTTEYEESGLDYVDKAGSVKDSKKDKNFVIKFLSKIKFKEVAPKLYMVNGKETECQGYQTSMTFKDFEKLYEHLFGDFDSEDDNILDRIRNDESLNITKVLEKMKKMDITIYTDGKLITGIDVKSPDSNDTIDITMDLGGKTEKIGIFINDITYLDMAYETDMQDLKIQFDDTSANALDVIISEKADSKTLTITGMNAIRNLIGPIEIPEDSSFFESLQLKAEKKVLDLIPEFEKDMKLSITYYDKSDIKTLDGEEKRIKDVVNASLITILSIALKMAL